MPSYIGLDTPIFGISIVPTCVSASGARGSAGALSGFGNVAGTVVVVDDVVVDVLVVLVVVDDVEVVGGIVVVVVVSAAVATGVAAAAAPRSDPLSPHAANVMSSTQAAEVQHRRMAHSASE